MEQCRAYLQVRTTNRSPPRAHHTPIHITTTNNNNNNPKHHHQPNTQEGIPVAVFPEGGRSEDGRLRPLKDGFFGLALQTGTEILVRCVVLLWFVLWGERRG